MILVLEVRVGTRFGERRPAIVVVLALVHGIRALHRLNRAEEGTCDVEASERVSDRKEDVCL